MVELRERPDPVEHHAGALGISWGGQREYVDRLVQGWDARLTPHVAEHVDGAETIHARLRLASLTLAESAELAALLVRTTAEMERFTSGLAGVGGPVAMATIARGAEVRIVDAGTRVEPASGAWVEVAEVASVVEVPADGVRPATFTVTRA